MQPLLAMTWELLRQSRWNLLLGFVGANALPLLLMTALQREGPLDPAEPALVTIQVVMVELHIFTLGAMLLAAQELQTRHLVLPMTTEFLVLARMLPAVVVMALMEAVSIVFLNVAFGLSWPLLAPVLLATTTIPIVLAASWIAVNTVWQPATITLAALIIGLWYKARCGPLFSMPTHVWSTVTLLDVLVLGSFTVISYVMAVVGVRRLRCGDRGTSPPWLETATRIIGAVAGFHSRPKSVLQIRDALFAAEWSRKGWILPVVVVWALLLGLVPWALFDQRTRPLLDGMISGAALLGLGGLLGGAMIGHCGSRPDHLTMGSFLATRPVCDRTVAWTLLKVAGLTSVVSWAIWALIFLVCLIGAAVQGTLAQWTGLSYWWLIPLALIACWISVATGACVMMSGYGKRASILGTIFITLFIVIQFVMVLVDAPARRMLAAGFISLIGITMMVATAFLYQVARRRDLADVSTCLMAGATWLALEIGISLAAVSIPLTIDQGLLLSGLAALAVVPFAAAPVGIAVNRHRA